VDPTVESCKLDRRLRRLLAKATSKLAAKVGEDVPVDTAFHISSKKGPNGPVLETIVDDAHAFTQDEKLVEAWKALNEETKS